MNHPTTKAELESLVKNQVQESLHLDYKDSRALDKNKSPEIAKDVSAFANSDGGIIIYGIREHEHLPVKIDDGIDHKLFSRERLEQIIQSNVSPRVDDLRIHQIPLSEDRSAFVIKIPKSYRGPHQERSSKRYYKRFNFNSEPMEDYEINDVRNRKNRMEPLVNIDVEIWHNKRILFVISNIGEFPALNVRFEFDPMLTWKSGAGVPPILEHGIKYFPPGRIFRFWYYSFTEILSSDNKVSSEFDVNVSYIHSQYAHSQNEQRISDHFHISLLDFLYTSALDSEIYTLGKTINKTLQELVREVKAQNQLFNGLLTIAGPTGINISTTALRNLRHIMSRENDYEKLDPNECGIDVFREILQIDHELAAQIESHFWAGKSSKDIDSIPGMTDEIIGRFRQHFVIEDT